MSRPTPLQLAGTECPLHSFLGPYLTRLLYLGPASPHRFSRTAWGYCHHSNKCGLGTAFPAPPAIPLSSSGYRWADPALCSRMGDAGPLKETLSHPCLCSSVWPVSMAMPTFIGRGDLLTAVAAVGPELPLRPTLAVVVAGWHPHTGVHLRICLGVLGYFIGALPHPYKAHWWGLLVWPHQCPLLAQPAPAHTNSTGCCQA